MKRVKEFFRTGRSGSPLAGVGLALGLAGSDLLFFRLNMDEELFFLGATSASSLALVQTLRIAATH
jgi:hypothetical protein